MMNTEESFSNLTYEDDAHKAERELAAFLGAVTELFGSEQADLSAEDWLDESELVDSAPRSASRQWRAVTVAASARLANRLNVELHRRASLETPYGVNGGSAGIGLDTAASSFD
jgi:hypothetical protein